MDPTPDSEPREARWRLVYRSGSFAALISAVLIPIQVVVSHGHLHFDGTAVDWFTLSATTGSPAWSIGPVLVADNATGPDPARSVCRLAAKHPSAVMIAAAAGFAQRRDVPGFQSSNPDGQPERPVRDRNHGPRATAAISAGTATLAMWQGTAFHSAYILGSLAGVLFGVVMVRGGIFGKPTAWLAILANTIGLGLYVPRVGVFIAVFSVLFLEVWYVLIARRLHRIARGAGDSDAGAAGAQVGAFGPVHT